MGASEAFFLSIVFGGIGLAALRYGKVTTQPKLMLIGIVLMAYTFVVTDPWWILGIGVALSAGLWFAAE